MATLKRRKTEYGYEYCCTSCVTWQDEDGFIRRPLRNGRAVGYGIDATCKKCRNHSHREWYRNNTAKAKAQQKKRNIKKKKLAKLLRSQDCGAVDCNMLSNELQRWRGNMTDVDLTRISGVSDKTLRRIKTKSQKTVKYYLADRLLTAIGRAHVLDDMFLKLDVRWSRKHDACISCETTNFIHQGHGLCRRCYQDPDSVRPLDSLWSWYYRHCIDPNCAYTAGGVTTKMRHYGHGLCYSCYKKNWKKKKQGKPSLLKDSAA